MKRTLVPWGTILGPCDLKYLLKHDPGKIKFTPNFGYKYLFVFF